MSDWQPAEDQQAAPANQESYDGKASLAKSPVSSQEIEDGKTLALLCHGSLLFGLPLFILPLLMRDNRFALHHAKAAGVTYVLFMMMAVLTVLTCGVAFPLIFLCYVPAFVGMVSAAKGELAGVWGMGKLGESLLSGIQVPPTKIPDRLV